MNDNCIQFSIESDIAQIRLDRPEHANGMNLRLMQELVEAVHTCEEEAVRALIITGVGKFFSAGGDLASFADDLPHLPRKLNELTLNLHGAISRLVRLNAPVIAAVNGPCAGAGMSLACACDLVLAAESSHFTMAYTAAGLSPDGSSTWFLPRRVGDLRARELMLTNRRLSAVEAVSWGLANRVVEDKELDREAMALARQLAAGPTLAYGKVKALVNDSLLTGLETQMELESRAIASSAKTRDAQEGIRSFLDKRSPVFVGD